MSEYLDRDVKFTLNPVFITRENGVSSGHVLTKHCAVIVNIQDGKTVLTIVANGFCYERIFNKAYQRRGIRQKSIDFSDHIFNHT